MKILTILFAFFFFASHHITAQELNVPKGKQFSYETQLVGSGTLMQTNIAKYIFKSLGRDSSGNNVFECRLVRAVDTDRSFASTPQLNTEDIYAMDFSGSGVLNTLALLGKTLKIIVSPKGKLLKIEGYDKVLREVEQNWKLQKGLMSQVSYGEKILFSNLERLFVRFPEDQLSKDGRWTTEGGNSYKVNPINNGLLSFSNLNREIKSLKNVNIKQTKEPRLVDIEHAATGFVKKIGKYKVDVETGLVRTAKSHESFQHESSSTVWVTDDDVQIKYSTNILEVAPDTAWINMVIRMSSWSDAFKTNNKFDESKMLEYFRTHDVAFSKNAHYNNRKLSLIQKLEPGASRDTLYHRTIKSIPDQYLVGTSQDFHIITKLGLLSEIDADGAYQAAKYGFHLSAKV